MSWRRLILLLGVVEDSLSSRDVHSVLRLANFTVVTRWLGDFGPVDFTRRFHGGDFWSGRAFFSNCLETSSRQAEMNRASKWT